MSSIYDILLQMPFFQGLSLEDFTKILEKVRFDFRKAEKEEVIVYQGDACSELIYVIKGEIVSSCDYPAENKIQIKEYFEAPELIEPYSLMGYQSYYTSTYQATSETQYVAINKHAVLSCLCEYEIFRINFLNILSRRAQLLREKVITPLGASLPLKVFNWMWRMCEHESGRKEFHIRMEDLAALIDETRLSVSRLLNEWQKNELIHLGRLRIEVPDFSRIKEHVKE